MGGSGRDATERDLCRADDGNPAQGGQRVHGVVRFAPVDGGYVVTDVSPAFEAVFGGDGPLQGRRVADLLSAIDGGAAALETALDGEKGRIELDGRTLDVECVGAAAVGRVRGDHDGPDEDDHPDEDDRPDEDGRSDEDRPTSALLFVDVTDYERQVATLEAEIERLRTFTHALAHDLRNPLELANVRLEAAEETGDLGHLEQVAAAHDRIERLIDDVLSMARNGDDLTDPESVALGPLVRDAWNDVEHGEATLTVDGPLPTVEGDPRRLHRLFENLFRNAVEHAGSDPAVRVARTDEGVAVDDDGPGIPEDQREDALSVGYSTQTEGTGLGLPIVSRVADAHGWSVELGSSEAGGARIHLVGARETVEENA